MVEISKEQLPLYSFIYLLLLEGLSVIVMLGGGIPVLWLLLPNSLPMILLTTASGLLTVSWILSGVAGGFLLRTWLKSGKQLFKNVMDGPRGNQKFDTYAFYLLLFTALFTGIAGLTGYNPFIDLVPRLLLYPAAVVNGIVTWYLFKRFKEAGKKVF